MKILVLTEEQVLKLADMRGFVDELAKTFVLLSKGEIESPVRTRFKMSEVRNVLLMPSLIRESANTLGLKIVSVYPDLSGPLPATRATVLLADGADGSVKCVMGGTALTGLRTGAVSGLSCRYLARRSSKDLAMIGAGGQGFYQISGVVSQLGIERVAIFDIDRARQRTLAERCRKELHLDARTTESVPEATRNADVVVTATTSKIPVLQAEHTRAGTHVVAIGAYTPDTRELASDLVSTASVYVDSMEAAMAEAGDILIPIGEGRMRPESVKGDLSGLATGRVRGRTSDEETTVFKAVGLAFEDNAVGWMVYRRALASGVGQSVET